MTAVEDLPAGQAYEFEQLGCPTVDCPDITLCSKCDLHVCTEHTDTAIDCACGTWHHEHCASDCDEWQYWEHYSREEDRLSDERAERQLERDDMEADIRSEARAEIESELRGWS